MTARKGQMVGLTVLLTNHYFIMNSAALSSFYCGPPSDADNIQAWMEGFCQRVALSRAHWCPIGSSS